MAKSAKPTDAEQVAQHIAALDPAIAKTVNAVRKIILGADKHISERIKWNNPSFYYSGPMQPFDPKEYKSEIAVFNLYKGRIMLVLPSGTKLNDQSGLLEGDYKDGRRTIVFKDEKDVKTKAKIIEALIKKWVSMVE